MRGNCGARASWPRSLDVHVGPALGLTFHQVQKYERGANRISASKLYAISRILDVPAAFFFEEMPDYVATHPARSTRATGDGDPMTKRETLELVRAYYRIKNPDIRKRLREMIKTVAAQER